ncbi:hypothetical protein [Brevundimonas sp. M20]|uniref:hypothetical protein n=1 Tax=Brevundimonas sp. M20 TaxID=2591463 RepID=UPI00114758F1|nr:hypothetical protein [Brevundimonas sp. M20]QDH72253.1 hypothetical protein FKQ52_01730 [Brevundimonas sp. M20]
MKMELSPTADALGELLSPRVKMGRKGDAVDEWYRSACDITFSQNGQTIIAQDDLGFFFQKWMLLLNVKRHPDGIWFMGAKALLRNGNVVIQQNGVEIKADRFKTRALFEAVSNELEQQLDALVAFQSSSESWVDHIRETYLAPLRNHVASL